MSKHAVFATDCQQVPVASICQLSFIIWKSLPWQSSDGMQDFFQKECWKHHPKPHADFMEMKQKEDQELAASRKKLIPGLA